MSVIDEDVVLSTSELIQQKYPYVSCVSGNMPWHVVITVGTWLDNHCEGAWDSLSTPDYCYYDVYFANVRHQQLFEIAWSEYIVHS